MKNLFPILFYCCCFFLFNTNTFGQDAPQEKSKAVLAIEANIVAGEQFLAENAKKKEIIVLPSGLQYEIIKKGAIKRPNINNTVKTHYHGTLIDGTVFDSSVDRGTPASFPLSRVIKGWQEGIPLMYVGAKYRFYIPYKLGYGLRSAGSIPGGSVLIFDVELLNIEG